MEEAIRQLREAREKAFQEFKALVDGAAKEARDLNDDEQTKYTELRAGLDKFDERIAELIEMDERAKKSAGPAAKIEGRSSVTVRSPKTYSKRSRNSYFLDLVRSQVNHDPDAAERLATHRKEESAEVEKRMRKMDDEGERAFRAEFGDGAEIERRDLSRTAGAGGEFVPPLWLIDEYIALARAARVTADLCNNRPLPPDTNVINIPRITGGTAVRSQASLGAVQKTDMTTNALTVNVETLAGQQDVELQLIEQTPIDYDEMVFQDLIADYNAQLDTQVIQGAGHGSSQLLGILNVSGIGSSTYTSGSPTVAGLYPKTADVFQQVGTNRKLPPTAYVMHTRRWGWFAGALDGNNRPLVVPTAPNGPFNAMAVNENQLAQGVVGNLQGFPVTIDPNVPTNLGAGTNEDRIICARFSDFWLWESFLRTRVLTEVLSNTLEVRLQVYNYVAFAAGRYAASTAVVAGTGLVTPTF